ESCVFDECVADIITQGSRLELMLWEISGLDDYESIRRELYRDSDVILVCFDIGQPLSLQSVINKVFYSFVVTFLIPCFQALDVAHSTMARDYIECCAKTRWNVKEVFKSAADAILFKNDDKVDEIKSQSVLKKFSWFSRRSSGSDIADCNTIPRSPSANRRLSLFSTS
ncbi:PREDICTED: GTP-binding protein Rho1-like, partial [Acropora digitifera]|uniref:GTP-binding protein Rho1-like n=1 Tax=Acropora digitifera TaxID=70779 RepID=UPI00077AE0AE